MRKKINKKKNYKRLSKFDRSLIMGLIINLLKYNVNISRKKIHRNINEDEKYCELVKNLGFIGSENLKKQYESLIDNNLGRLIKNGIVMINNEKKYKLTPHGDDLWLKYNNDWYLLPISNKQTKLN